MPAHTLPLEAWLVVGAIAWVTVRQCVKVLERHLSYGLRFRKLVRDVQRVRDARLRKLQEPAKRARGQVPRPEPEIIEVDVEDSPVPVSSAP